MSVNSPTPVTLQWFTHSGKASPRLPAVPHRLVQYRKRRRWQSTDLLCADGAFDFNTVAAKRVPKPRLTHVPPPSKQPVAGCSFVSSNSNENLRAGRHERTLLLCKKPPRAAQRVLPEDKLKILTVSAYPGEPRPAAGTRIRRGHVKGALTSFGVQASFDDE